eukprot:m.19981 g.19981  ORF g.19981 m.19981 type:complete len:592 (+) comp27941_c0_seq1:293-2068(+)
MDNNGLASGDPIDSGSSEATAERHQPDEVEVENEKREEKSKGNGTPGSRKESKGGREEQEEEEEGDDEASSSCTISFEEMRDYLSSQPDSQPQIVALLSQTSKAGTDEFVGVVSSLQDKGIDVQSHVVTVTDANKKISLTILHWATIFNRVKLIKWLFTQGCSPLDRDPITGGTALHNFLLHRERMRPKSNGEYAFEEIVPLLFEDAITVPDYQMNTPLLVAIQYLISSGLPAYAFAECCIKVLINQARISSDVKILLDAKDRDGSTGLHLLAPHDSLALFIKLLVKNGASTQLVNNEGLTAYEVALHAMAKDNLDQLSSSDNSLSVSALHLQTNEEPERRSKRPTKRKSDSSFYTNPIRKKQSPPVPTRREVATLWQPPATSRKSHSPTSDSASSNQYQFVIKKEGGDGDSRSLRSSGFGPASDGSSRHLVSPRSARRNLDRIFGRLKKGGKAQSGVQGVEETHLSSAASCAGGSTIIASFVEAGLLDDMVETAKQAKEKKLESLPALRTCVFECEKEVKKARADVVKCTESVHAVVIELQEVATSLQKAREAEKECLHKRDEAEKKLQEAKAKIRHCEKIVDEVPFLEI